MNNVLDLTALDLKDEAAFLFALGTAFDSGNTITEAKITSSTASMLLLSAMTTRIGTTDAQDNGGLWYISPFGYVELTPVSKIEINQVSIHD